jgi:hypothetical protein
LFVRNGILAALITFMQKSRAIDDSKVLSATKQLMSYESIVDMLTLDFD